MKNLDRFHINDINKTKNIIFFSAFSDLTGQAIGNNGMISFDNKNPETNNETNAIETTRRTFTTLSDEVGKLKYTFVVDSIKSILQKKETVIGTVENRDEFNKKFNAELRKQLLNLGMDESRIHNFLLAINASISTRLQPKLLEIIESKDVKINNIDNFTQINRITNNMIKWLDNPSNSQNNNKTRPTMPSFGPSGKKPRDKSAESYLN